MKICKNCSVVLTTHQYVYCSNTCQSEVKYKNYISQWKAGTQDGNIGISTGNISGYIRRYIFTKYNESCSICRWSTKNTYTGKIPLEIDHIDGDSKNNNEENLRLLCPNCHSLTEFYKNHNRGKGRSWRKEKYLKN